jgi:hypothetical protein
MFMLHFLVKRGAAIWLTSVTFLCALPLVRATASDAANTNISIRLRIIDSATQLAVTNARVALLKPIADLEPLGHSTNGIFAFTHTDDTNVIKLRVQADHFSTHDLVLKVTNSTIDQIVPLDRTATFRGFALAPTGQPVKNADVALLKKYKHARITPKPEIQTFKQLPQVTTEHDGYFRIGPDKEAQSILIVHNFGVAHVPIVGWTNETTIQLRPWAPARGKFLINNVPAANQTIAASNVKLHGSPWPVHLDQFQAETDAAGNFFFDRLPPGEINLTQKITTAAHGYTFSHGHNFFIDQAFPADIYYHLRGRSIHGQLVAADPDFDWNAEHIFVHLYASARPPSEFAPLGVPAWPSHFAVITDNAGKFNATAIPPGEYTLRLHAHRRDHRSDLLATSVTIPPGAEPLDLGDVTLTNSVVTRITPQKPSPR